MDLSSNVKFSIWVFFVILLAYTAGCWTTPGPRTYASPPNSHYTPRGGRGHTNPTVIAPAAPSVPTTPTAPAPAKTLDIPAISGH
jgi:hypothetical protein